MFTVKKNYLAKGNISSAKEYFFDLKLYAECDHDSSLTLNFRKKCYFLPYHLFQAVKFHPMQAGDKLTSTAPLLLCNLWEKSSKNPRKCSKPQALIKATTGVTLTIILHYNNEIID